MNFKRYYLNGKLSLFGSRNLYGKWNTLMWKLTCWTTKDKETVR